MSELLEDHFKDEGEVKVYGEDIEQDRMICSDIGANELPESKSNTVSFMKVEDLPADCRNLLAVSESCICYSVTQKKNLLRLMDTISGEKEILRGHESAVNDVKFSVDSTVLCSTDSGAAAGKAHTIVWRKAEGSISYTASTQSSLKGTMLAAHPLQNSVWAISDKNSVGVFNAGRINLNIPTKYAELPMSATFDGEKVTGIAFTPNGKNLIVTLESQNEKMNHFHVYAINGVGSDGLIKGNESLTRLVNHQPYAFDKDFYAETILAVQCVHNWIVTASLSTSGTAGTESYCIHVWNNSASTPTIVQTISLELPSFSSKINSTSLANPSLVCTLSADSKNSRYLIFSSRKSSFVACLAVSPAFAASLPLYHITYLNLKAPTVSMDVTTILGRAHHSAEEGEHLEMSCYQEEASDQASIQQYHVLFGNLFDYEKYVASTRRIRSRPSSQSNLQEYGIIGGPLRRLSSNEAATTAAAPVSPQSKSKTILSFLNSANTIGIVPAPKSTEADRFQSPPATSTAGLTASLSSANSDLPGFLNFKPATNTSILSMIKGNSTESSVTSFSTPGVKTVAPITPVATIAAPVIAPAAEKATPKGTKSDATKEKLLHVQEKVHLLSKEHESSHSSEPHSRSNKKAEKILNSFADDRSDTGSIGSVPKNLSTPTSNILAASSIDLNGTPASMLSSLADIKQAVRQIAKNSVTREGLETVKEELIKDHKAGAQKSAESVSQAIKKTVEVEVKKSIEAAFSGGKWKQEISAAIIEALQADLAPIVAQKVRDSVKDTVKDTVKSVLTSSFRSSFESTLVPSFQVGTERMFAQVQSSFDIGLAGLVEEGRKAHQSTARSTEALENEIRELKHTIHRLEAKVVELSDTMSTAGVAVGPKEEAEAAEDAFALLEKGLVSDAVLRALEDKDVSLTVSLLDRLTPSQVNAKCSNLVRLCITQQLAADMSVNIPEEGVAKRVEWIKNLVLSLVSGPSAAGSDPTYDRSFKSTIQLVLESIQSAKQIIFTDNGDDSHVPQSVGTDLQLLEFVIQSKL